MKTKTLKAVTPISLCSQIAKTTSNATGTTAVVGYGVNVNCPDSGRRSGNDVDPVRDGRVPHELENR